MSENNSNFPYDKTKKKWFKTIIILIINSLAGGIYSIVVWNNESWKSDDAYTKSHEPAWIVIVILAAIFEYIVVRAEKKDKLKWITLTFLLSIFTVWFGLFIIPQIVFLIMILVFGLTF